MQEIMTLAHQFLQNFCAGNQQNQALLHKHINLFLNPGASKHKLPLSPSLSLLHHSFSVPLSLCLSLSLSLFLTLIYLSQLLSICPSLYLSQFITLSLGSLLSCHLPVFICAAITVLF